MKMLPLIWTITLIAPIWGAVLAPPWADPEMNPCAKEPRGWQMLFWPPDGQCYKIFQVGPPCPPGMELSPAQSRTARELYAECRCPPKMAFSNEDGKCYGLFGVGPCEEGEFFGPDGVWRSNVTTSTQQLGTCQPLQSCPNPNDLFWPKDQKCYQKLTRGPCPKGQLLTEANKLPTCACGKQKELQKYRAINDKCYQHFTKGPCKEKGDLFLPDQSCGCYDYLPHYHKESRKCYELGTIGPCNKGEMFTILPKTSTGGCMCRPGYIRHQNNPSCHRPFTQGPCQDQEILLNSTTCIRQPCQRGQLYHPDDGFCYKIGSQGPCPVGQIVSFDFGTRPSIDGVSYNAVCMGRTMTKCDKMKNLIDYGGQCVKLYSQGACSKNAWVVPQRKGRTLLEEEQLKGVCECIPGAIRRVREVGGRREEDCLQNTEVVVEFLNRNFTRNQV